jgi:hypothetical protein
MKLQREIPSVLESWLELVSAHERFARDCIGTARPVPTGPMIAFAGSFVAGLSGGVVDPESDGTVLLLPNGQQAVVGVASEERGINFGLAIDSADPPAPWIALVAFRQSRPVAVHVIDARHLRQLRDLLGVPVPLPPKAPPGAMVLSTAFHWNLCLERLTASALGVVTHYLSTGGLSLEPHPVCLPQQLEHPIGEVA